MQYLRWGYIKGRKTALTTVTTQSTLDKLVFVCWSHFWYRWWMLTAQHKWTNQSIMNF